MGSIDAPFNPLVLAIGAGCTFVCRSVDVFTKHLVDTLKRMHGHQGTSFIEIYQNCNIFNDGAWSDFTDRGARDEKVLYLEPGQPLIWGKAARFGFVAEGFGLTIVPVNTPEDEARVLRHDPTNKVLAQALAGLDPSKGEPVPVGVFYTEQRAVYDQLFQAQLHEATTRQGLGDLQKLLNAGDTWNVG